MMMVFTILMIGLSVFEIVSLWRKGAKKDMVILVGLAIITWVFGYYYITNPYRDGLARIALEVLDSIMGKAGG